MTMNFTMDEETPKKEKPSKVELVDRTMTISFDEKEVMQQIIEKKKQIDTSRSEWYERKLEFLYQWDNFVDYRHEPILSDQPYYHIPLTHEKIQAWHARMYKTITGMDPMFTMIPLNVVSLPEMQATKMILQWYLRDEINQQQGIKPVIDELLWDMGTDGWGIICRRWDIIERRMLDVVANDDLDQSALREELRDVASEVKKRGRPPKGMKPYKEIPKIVKVYSGIVLETVPQECMYFPEYIPTSGDMNYPELIIIESVKTKDDYLKAKEQSYYSAKAVDEALKSGKGFQSANKRELKNERERLQGIARQMWEDQNSYVTDHVFMRRDFDGDGILEEYIFTVNLKSRQFLRTTFLDRVCPDGKRPVHKFDLMKRPRSAYSRGFPELLYSLNNEVDEFHNIRRISGLVANVPWGFYRAAGGFEKEPIEVAPGKFFPTDEPQSDIRPMNFPNVTSWAMQEEALAYSYADRLTSMPSYLQGAISGPVGPLRSNSGLNTLLQESQAPLDVYLDRFRVAFNGLMQGILSDLRVRLPKIIMLKVLGENGEPLFDPKTQNMVTENIPKSLILNGKYKFNLTANDAQYNPEKDRQDMMAISQMLLTQIGMGSGIVSPMNQYNIYKDNIEKTGRKDFDRYITKPQEVFQPLNLQQEIATLNNGQMPYIGMNDKHEEKIAGLTAFVQSPEYEEGIRLKLIPEFATYLYAQAINTHQQYLQMLNSMPAQANQSGLEIPVTMGARQAGVGPGQGNELPQGGGMNGPSGPAGSANTALPAAGVGEPNSGGEGA